MPSPISGHHQEETVTPNVDVMGQENIQENMTQPPSFVRQRSRVEPVEDDSDENTKSLKTQKSNGHFDTGSKSVKFSSTSITKTYNDGACGSNDDLGICLRPPEDDEEAPFTSDNKIEKHRQRQQKKKRVRRQWLTICTCGLVIFLIAAAALAFAVYNHYRHNDHSTKDNPELGTLYCYPCELVKAEDIITYNEKYTMCCVGKNAEVRSSHGKQVSPLIAEKPTEEDNKPEVHKVKFKEMKVKVDQNDEDKELGFQIASNEDENQFLALIAPDNKGIEIEESGLYMLTLTLTTKAPDDDGYYRFISCLRFVRKSDLATDECRKVTLLRSSGHPFEIHKTLVLEKGTIVQATVTEKSLLDSNVIFNKLIITQLHKLKT